MAHQYMPKIFHDTCKNPPPPPPKTARYETMQMNYHYAKVQNTSYFVLSRTCMLC